MLATTTQGDIAFDFRHCVSSGAIRSISAKRPELAAFADQILLWRDRFSPPSDQSDDSLGAHPYLGSGHELLEKEPGRAPYLRNIHVFNPAAFVSFGLPIGDVPSFRRDIPGVVARISRDLFLDDLSAHESRINASIADDFGPALYASAIWRSPTTVAAE